MGDAENLCSRQGRKPLDQRREEKKTKSKKTRKNYKTFTTCTKFHVGTQMRHTLPSHEQPFLFSVFVHYCFFEYVRYGS
uniref:Serine/threonine-protein kinase TOUSLED-like n=1 Tax=Rhizophora mucronata TaxID=61149 RepID=A0A2P2Q8U3_RHIMU